ncbi:hypothetical protein Q4544_07985 [Cognatishimia sp. 1_MG-2023]|uniref:hypothetical protein n=1 Tax=Cognatishimia sp. 1_MG-2023 TaxID=3062642 RepID=UPI0026E30506|nr:hypothetical protein [Cognatishimia sp. 1_MG-2023]MDO6726868.1 hypothetical protein [Cognatishimia sp. 1_MG-2023]
MSQYSVSKTRLFEGVWEGVVSTSDDSAGQPQIDATHQEQPLPNLRLTDDGHGKWTLRIPIPANLLADGVQTILIRDSSTHETLDSIVIVSGEPLSEDIRAEMDLLRAELDMLKRAFRRHCLETM